MYYEERLINGVMHSCSAPGEDWIPMSQERLSAMVLELRKMLDSSRPGVFRYPPDQPDFRRWWYEKQAPYATKPADQYTWYPPDVTCNGGTGK